jgi:hypothetical protein
VHKPGAGGGVLWFPLGEFHHLRVGFKELGFYRERVLLENLVFEFCVQEVMLLAGEEYHV